MGSYQLHKWQALSNHSVSDLHMSLVVSTVLFGSLPVIEEVLCARLWDKFLRQSSLLLIPLWGQCPRPRAVEQLSHAHSTSYLQVWELKSGLSNFKTHVYSVWEGTSPYFWFSNSISKCHQTSKRLLINAMCFNIKVKIVSRPEISLYLEIESLLMLKDE